jgi:hypothetical protein
MAENDGKKVAEQATKEAQKVVDAEHEKGFAGTPVDPTPRDNYTVSGVTAGKPTPETDDGLADEAAAVYRKGV